MQFTDHGVEGVVPVELLPPDFRFKYQSKPNDRAKRAKKEEAKGSAQQGEENEISTPASENDEGIRGDLEASTTPMDAKPETAGVTDMVSHGASPMPDENQKQSSHTDADPEMGQLEADSEAEAGIIEGEVDLDVAS
ncbi:THO complex subunit 1-like [Cannabis sativa]|uniref:THO complex subunit 1-like n=1 Tax=Cannabis sativa TaxID=3483 RepID=UPI0029CA7FD6|nr:THO complex subunit 1-like [Cannabis sativa]